MLKRRGWLSWTAAALTALVLLAGGFTAGVFVDQRYPDQVPLLGLHPQQRGQLNQAELDQAFRVIQAHYYDSRLDYRKISRGSIKGMVQSLGDPYSEYLEPDQFKSREDFYAGRHTGMIGIYVNYNGEYPTISGLVPGSPAQKVGLQSDDVILAINGTDAHGIKTEQTSALIRGPVGTIVTLKIRRGVEVKEVQVTRGDFHSPTVLSVMLEDRVFYLRVYEFGNATQREFDDQLRAGLPKAHGVIVDLRNNGGGFVSAATAMISRFVSDGEAFEIRGRDGRARVQTVEGDHPAATVPLAVLVNGNSASASEIVAGALQARGRATLVGVKTFGKGSIQVDYRLDDGSDIHLTIEHWFLPGGRSVDNKMGLVPDLPVELPESRDMFDIVQPTRGHAADVQLNRALALVASK